MPPTLNPARISFAWPAFVGALLMAAAALGAEPGSGTSAPAPSGSPGDSPAEVAASTPPAPPAPSPPRASAGEKACYLFFASIGARSAAVDIFASDWSELAPAAAQARLADLRGRELVLRTRAGGKLAGLMGTLESLEVGDGVASAILLDGRGTRHLVFLPEEEVILWVPPVGVDPYYLAYARKAFSRHFERVDPELYAAGAEQRRASLSPDELARLDALFREGIEGNRMSRLSRLFAQVSRLGASGPVVSLSLWIAIGTLRHSVGVGHDWFLDHGSDAIFAWGGIPLLHAWMSQERPERRNAFLAVASLSFLGLLVFEEVDFGFGRLSGGASDRVGTDWADLSSGLAGTALYAAVIKALEAQALRARERR